MWAQVSSHTHTPTHTTLHKFFSSFISVHVSSHPTAKALLPLPWFCPHSFPAFRGFWGVLPVPVNLSERQLSSLRDTNTTVREKCEHIFTSPLNCQHWLCETLKRKKKVAEGKVRKTLVDNWICVHTQHVLATVFELAQLNSVRMQDLGNMF